MSSRGAWVFLAVFAFSLLLACVGDEPAGESPGDAGCVPTKMCIGKNCGEIPDGCGGQITCGSCSAPETCGAGGEPNVCGRPGPTISSITMPGRSDNQIRQGTAAPGVKIVVAGADLDGATIATVGTKEPIFAPVAANESNATTATFYLAVPHGAPLGTTSVSIATPHGSATRADAITITPITASANNGSDSSGDGRTALPYKTCKRALAEASSGDTVLLEDGTYDAANGEDWPTFISTGFGAFDANENVPPLVTVKGRSTTGTKLVGPGATPNGPGRLALVSKPPVATGAKIESLTISGFTAGILAVGGELDVKDVVVETTGNGIYVRGSGGALLTNVVLRSNLYAGLATFDSTSVALNFGRISKNDIWGIYSTTSGALDLVNTEIDENDFSGLTNNDVGGILATGLGSTKRVGNITLTGVNFHDNKRNGIDVRETNGPTNLTITGAQFRRDAIYAVGFGLNVTTKIRNTTFELAKNGSGECINQGVYFHGGTLDLGTATEDGNNQFILAATGTCFGFQDVRAPGTGLPTTTKNTSFSNTALPLIPAAGCSAATTDRKWRIEQPGTCPSTGNVVQSH